MINPIVYCSFEGAKWFLFGPNVPNIIYYSHIPNIIISLILAFFILFQNRKALTNKILFFTILAFDSWVFFALAFWATNRSDMIMFTWLMDILVEPLVYIGALYLLYALIDKKDISFNKKLFLGLLYLPILIFLPTKLMLSGFDVSSCLATEGPIAMYYTYFVEIFVSIWIIILCVRRYFAAKESKMRKEILYLSIGIILLLFMFAWGNIIGSFTDNWQLGDYGLFGMPIFLAFLTYLIVKFETFNIKLLGAQALVWSLVLLVGSQFFYLSNSSLSVKVLTAITLIISSTLGLLLVRSVKKEVALREKLEIANEGQTNLIHIMNHQIKGYLTINKDIFAELLTDDYGKVPEEAREIIAKGLESSDKGQKYVTDILKGASAENETLYYDMKKIDFKEIVSNEIENQKMIIEKKKLKLDVDISNGDYNMIGDKSQLGEAIRNLIENSICYTITGSISINLKSKSDKIIFSIKDTGVGVKAEDKDKIFKAGGVGCDSIKINVNSSGYGLAFVKGVVEKHKGKVWFESAGEGKGSTFYVELPMK